MLLVRFQWVYKADRNGWMEYGTQMENNNNRSVVKQHQYTL